MSTPESSSVPLGELPTDVVWQMALDGTIEYVSSEVFKVRGLTSDEAKAQMVDQIHTPESAERSIGFLQQVIQAHAAGEELPTFHDVLTYLRADGTEYPCEVRAIAQVNDDGEVKILGVSRGVFADEADAG
jgi:PAS domain S-box-containing protein